MDIPNVETVSHTVSGWHCATCGNGRALDEFEKPCPACGGYAMTNEESYVFRLAKPERVAWWHRLWSWLMSTTDVHVWWLVVVVLILLSDLANVIIDGRWVDIAIGVGIVTVGIVAPRLWRMRHVA